MLTIKRRIFTNNIKTKVVIEALKECETIQQLAVKYEIHLNQITTWKKQFLDNADAILDRVINSTHRIEHKGESLRKKQRLNQST